VSLGFPDVLDIPAEEFLCGRGVTNQEGERIVETVERTALSDNAEVHELADGAGAEDVDEWCHGQPEGPGSYAAVSRKGLLGFGFVVGLGLVLADGLYVHDWSLRLKVRSSEGEFGTLIRADER
jgi:hypothetical protein